MLGKYTTDGQYQLSITEKTQPRPPGMMISIKISLPSTPIATVPLFPFRFQIPSCSHLPPPKKTLMVSNHHTLATRSPSSPTAPKRSSFPRPIMHILKFRHRRRTRKRAGSKQLTLHLVKLDARGALYFVQLNAGLIIRAAAEVVVSHCRPGVLCDDDLFFLVLHGGCVWMGSIGCDDGRLWLGGLLGWLNTGG